MIQLSNMYFKAIEKYVYHNVCSFSLLWYVQYVLSSSGDFPIFFNFFVTHLITIHTYESAQLLGSAAMTLFCVLLFWGATFKKWKMKDPTNYRPLISVPGKWQRCTCKYFENSRITLKHQQGVVKKKASPLTHFNWVIRLIDCGNAAGISWLQQHIWQNIPCHQKEIGWQDN